MTKKPKKASSSLVDKLNLFYYENRTPTQFEIVGIKREAELLKKVDAFSSYIVLGMLACFEHDPDSMRKNHEIAINMYPTDFHANANYATSLSNMGFYSDALPYYKTAYGTAPDDPKLLRHIIECMGQACRFFEASKMIGEYYTLVKDEPLAFEFEITHAVKILQEAELSDTVTNNFLDVATNTMHQQGIHYLQSHISIVADGQRIYIDYELRVEATPEMIVDLNIALVNALTSKFESTHSDKIIFTYTFLETERMAMSS